MLSGRFRRARLSFRFANLRRDAPYYTGGNASLELEEFRYRAIVAISPDNRARLKHPPIQP